MVENDKSTKCNKFCKIYQNDDYVSMLCGRRSFEGVGCVPGTTKIAIDPNSQPAQDACRRVPFPPRGKLKAELDRMEKLGVIIKKNSPTVWVSSLCVVVRPSGDFRGMLGSKNSKQSDQA